LCQDGWAAITAITYSPIARHSGNAATGTYATDAIIVVVCNIEIIIRPHGHSTGGSQLCLGGWAAITAIACAPITRDSGNAAIRFHTADTIIDDVSDVETSIRAHRDSNRSELCLGGWAAVTAFTIGAVAGHCCNNGV
jgi:hypothetical protein